MMALDSIRLGFPVEPAVDGREGNSKFLGELRLRDFIVEPIRLKLFHDVHKDLHCIAFIEEEQSLSLARCFG